MGENGTGSGSGDAEEEEEAVKTNSLVLVSSGTGGGDGREVLAVVVWGGVLGAGNSGLGIGRSSRRR